MCGIVGLVAPDSAVPAVERAVSVLAHRGPDDSGVWSDGGIVLGHTRLAILDLTDWAHQPMRTVDGRFVLSFNGEVYNYAELGAELTALGHSIRSTGDSEVILHAFEQWGPQCVARFNGMWALAIWDTRRRELFCSRDRFGVKPFYYAKSALGFAFGSEIKALLAIDRGLAQPDEHTLYRFLSRGSLDEGEATFLSRVRQLPGSHNMWVRADGSVEIARYYDLAAAALEEEVNLADAPARIRELLTDSVRLRLRSDVPVGTCLSGGLDSSAIVGLAGQAMDHRVSTFTSIYPGTDSDESTFAHAVVALNRTDAHWTEPQKENFFALFPRIAWHQDEPTSAPGLYSQWHVMQLACGNVKVLLDGQGGDEVFAGYLGHYAQYTSALLSDVARGHAWALRRLLSEYAEIEQQLGRSPIRAAALAATPGWARSLYRRTRRLGVDRPPLVSPEFVQEYETRSARRMAAGRLRDPLNTELLDSLVRSTIPSLLHYEDRNSMAFSIEARVPLLDYRLVQYGLALPYHSKMRGWETKAVFREAVADILPAEVLRRRDKKGYPTPLALWLREGLMPKTREILLSPEARGRGLLVTSQVEQMLSDHEAGRRDAHWEIWRLLSLEMWYRTFIDSQLSTPVTL